MVLMVLTLNLGHFLNDKMIQVEQSYMQNTKSWKLKLLYLKMLVRPQHSYIYNTKTLLSGIDKVQ